MKAQDQEFHEFLKREHHLNIPIYQRKYSWENKQCQKLLYDIIEIGKNDKKDNHFIGTIVFQTVMEKIIEITLIDGQQRITSMSLLILALAKYLKENDELYHKYDIEETADNLIKRYIINPLLKENRNKLVLTEEDNNIYKKIVESVCSDTRLELTDEEESNKVNKNFKYFFKGIDENNVVYILNGIEKLFIITLDLQDSNNAQEIFESMNSTGKDLKKSDLIRNFLLMDLSKERQNEIYNNYWRNIELTFDNNDSAFDDFIHNYLIMKTSKEINKNEVYDKFKEFTDDEFDKVDEIVKDIQIYANYFSKIVHGKEKNPDLNFALKNLSRLSYFVLHPFLFKLYDDYCINKTLSAKEFVKIVEYTESYVFRRYVLGLHTNVLRNVFKDMYGKLNKQDYVESYKYYLYKLIDENSNRRMPTDEEFIEELGKINVMNLTRNKKYIFDRLENFGVKAPANIYSKEYQIEHIMPQTLTEEWKHDLGKDWKRIHRDYLNTIGNITIIEYNPELKNDTYPNKKSKEGKGYIYSSVKLNNYFINVDKWDKEEIIKRRNSLCEKALKIWKFPLINDEILDKYAPSENNS